jgi:hypothetical protein
MNTRLSYLVEELRLATGLVEDDPRVTAQRANVFAGKAAKKGDRKAMVYWRGVLANAQARLRSAAGEPAKTHGGEEEPEHDKPKTSFRDKLKNVGKAAVAGAKSVAGSALQGLKNVPAASRKLVSDSGYRKETGKKVAAALKRGVAKTVLHACEEVGEVISAGVVVGKAASGKKLTKHDKHILKAGAKALATTLIGTVAIGGIAHLTAIALAQHFAIETAAKSIGKAALYADLTTEADQSAALKMWAEHIANAVVKGFEGLGSMSDDKLAEILSKTHG